MVPPDQDIPVDPLDDELAERGRALIAAAVAETMAPLALRERIEADRARAGQNGGARRSRGLLGKLVPAGGSRRRGRRRARARPRRLERPERARHGLAGRRAARSCPRRPRTRRTAPSSRPRWTACPSPTGAVPSSGRPWARATTRSRTAARRPSSTTTPRAPAPPTRSSAATRSTRRRTRARRHRNGIKLWITQDHGRRIVTWTRDGHTCVLSAPLSVPEQKLLELASWKGKGGVPF